MSIREKQALITLLAVLVVATGYAAMVLHATPTTLAEAAPGLIGAALLMAAITILAQIVLAIFPGGREAADPADERDRLVRLSSRRNAGWVGLIGLWFVLAVTVLTPSRLTIAYAALGAFTLAEIVMYGSELFYYRRGL
jgi:hypothetical protein